MNDRLSYQYWTSEQPADGWFARRITYHDRAVRTVDHVPPAPDAGNRRTHAMPPVVVEHIGDGRALVAGTFEVPLRAGPREVVGALRDRGRVKLRVHCHACGVESVLSQSAWVVATNKGSSGCRACAMRAMKREHGGLVPSLGNG